MRKPAVFSRPSLKALFAMQSLTLSTPSARLLLAWTSCMRWSVKAALFMVLADRCTGQWLYLLVWWWILWACITAGEIFEEECSRFHDYRCYGACWYDAQCGSRKLVWYAYHELDWNHLEPSSPTCMIKPCTHAIVYNWRPEFPLGDVQCHVGISKQIFHTETKPQFS